MKRLLNKSSKLLFCSEVILKFRNPSLPLLLIRLTTIFFCLTTNSTLFAAAETDRSLDSVTLKLKWKHQFQFAGYYAALEKGFYRQAGLDVKIIEATEGEESTKTVLKGDAEFGTAMSDLVLLRAKGQPVVALAAIFQHSPLTILVPKNTGIQNIHDLSSRRIALEPHSEELVAYMKHEGIPLSDMVVHAHTYDTSPLVNGDIDAMSAYSTDEPFMLSEKGVEYNLFSARSGGIDFYGDTLFTTEQQLREHPERVSAFLKASIAGWQYALSHSGEIIDLILSNYSRRHSREHLVFEAQQTKRLIMADVVGIGYMNPGRWEHIADTYAELGMTDKDYSLEGFIYDPSPETDFRRLYIILAVVISIALLVFLIAAYFYKLNQSLKEEMKERHLAENALKKQKETVQKYLDIAGVMFVVLDNEGEVILINRKGCEALGYDQKDIIGKNWFDHFIPKRMRAELKDVFFKMMSGAIESVEYFNNPVLTKRGHERIIDWQNTLLMDDAGQIIGTLSSGNDITERKQAEEERDRIINLSHNLICVAGTDGFFKFLNPAWEEVLGYTRDEMLSRPFLDFIHPDDHAKNDAEVERLAAGHETVDFENRYIHKNGNIITVSWAASPLPEENLIYCVGRDITGKREAEEALRKAHDALEMRVRERTAELQETNRQLQLSEERLALIYDSTADILFYISVEPDDCFRFLSINPAFLDATGMTQDQIVGKCIEEVIPENSIQLVLDNYNKAIKENRIVRWEETSVYPSGEKIGYVSIAPIFNEKGISTNLVGSLHDITEQRKAELNYRTVADFTYDWEYWANMDGTLNYVSPSCKRISGYSVQDFMDNPSLFREHIVPQDREIWDRHYRDSRRELKPRELQFRIQRPDGEIRWIEHACQPVSDNTGRNLGFRASNRDVSERKQIEEGLRQSKEFNRAILMSLSDHVAVLDREGNILTFLGQLQGFRVAETRVNTGAVPGRCQKGSATE